MLHLVFSGESRQPLYQQLYTQIRQLIRSGLLPHGTRLPSVRSLQLQYNISKTTIETAYQMLIAEGYVVSRPRSGLYVVNPYSTAHSDTPLYPAGEPVRLLPKAQPAPVSISAPRNLLVDFRPSATDEESFPIRTWKRMLHTALEQSTGNLCRYGDPQGEYGFRAVLAEYLRNSRGVVCTPEQIVIGSGIPYAVGILAKLLSDRGRIAFEEPGYAPVREQFRLHGFQVIPVPVQEPARFPERLAQHDAQAVYVTPSHQFPTGSVMAYAEREALLRWAQERDAYIIEDDYDGEFRYLGKPIPSLQGLDRHGRVIYIGTFSKAFTPALRLNYMVLPQELTERVRQMPFLLDCPSRIDQWAMQLFMEEGHWSRHIRRMRNTYRKKHQRFISLIQSHFGDRVDITGHSAGLHVQITVRTRTSAGTLVQLAADAGVGVYDLREMWMNPDDAGYPQIYLGFGGVSERAMEAGMERLKQAWAEVWER